MGSAGGAVPASTRQSSSLDTTSDLNSLMIVTATSQACSAMLECSHGHGTNLNYGSLTECRDLAWHSAVTRQTSPGLSNYDFVVDRLELDSEVSRS